MNSAEIIMPFGRYIGVSMTRIPAEYLLWLASRHGLKHSHRAVYEFALRRSISYLKSQLEDCQVSPRMQPGQRFRVLDVAEFIGAAQ